MPDPDQTRVSEAASTGEDEMTGRQVFAYIATDFLGLVTLLLIGWALTR